MNTRFFLRAYFLTLAFIFAKTYLEISSANFAAISYIGFALPFSFLSQEVWSYLIILSVALLLIGALRAANHRSLRICACILALVLFSLKVSFGKIDHDDHIWMIASILMCFIESAESLSSFKNEIIIRMIQISLLSTYFISGLWKLRSIGLFENFAEFLQKAPLDHIGYVSGQGLHPSHWIFKLIDHYPDLYSAGFFCVLVFQLLCFVPLIKPKSILIFGVGCLLFHFTTSMALGIYFTDTRLACVLFLILVEILRFKPKLFAFSQRA